MITCRRICLLALALGPPLASDAQGPRTGGPVGFSLGSSYEYTAPAGIDGGDIDLERWTAGAGLRLRVSAHQALRLSLEQEEYRYQAGDDSPLAGILEDASRTRLSVGGNGELPGPWSWLATLGAHAAAAEGARTSDSLGYSGLLLASRRQTTNVTWSVGLIGWSRQEEPFFAVPIAGVDWQITDRWSLRTSDGVLLAYALDPDHRWALEWETRYERREFRLPENDQPWSDGACSDRRVPTTLALAGRPLPFVQVRAYAGLNLWREFEVHDPDGDSLLSTDADPSLLAGLSLSLRF